MRIQYSKGAGVRNQSLVLVFSMLRAVKAPASAAPVARPGVPERLGTFIEKGLKQSVSLEQLLLEHGHVLKAVSKAFERSA